MLRPVTTSELHLQSTVVEVLEDYSRDRCYMLLDLVSLLTCGMMKG